MAQTTNDNRGQNVGAGGTGQTGMQKGPLPLDNLSYDLVTILHEKSKALEAYDRYLADAQKDPECLRLLQRIRQEDEQHVTELKRCLARCLNQGQGTQGGPSGGGIRS